MLTRVNKIDLACGETYLAKYCDDTIIELGDIFMSQEKTLGSRPYAFKNFKNPSDLNKRVMTICTMSGCPMTCTFCASKNSFKRKLTANELLEQVDFLINEGTEKGRHPDPSKTDEFRVLYTRMGEPLLNLDNVIDSMQTLLNKYPNIIFGLSTCGIKQHIDKLLKYPDIMAHTDFQISLHSTKDRERSHLFGQEIGNVIMTIDEIAIFAKRFYEKFHKPISLNTILFDGYTYEFKKLLTLLDKQHFWLRLSPWNKVNGTNFKSLLATDDVIHKKPLSNQNLSSIINEITELGIAYSYAPAIDEEIKHNVACGQAFEAFNIKEYDYVRR